MTCETGHFLDVLELPADLPEGRIVLGGEICLGRMPDLETVNRVLDRLSDEGRPWTWVLPPLGPWSLEDPRPLLDVLARRAEGGDPVELVCNDWGSLHACLDRPAFETVLGRLLVPQAVDPRWGESLISALDGLAEEDRRELMAPRLDPAFVGFLKAKGLRRAQCSWTPWLAEPVATGLRWTVIEPWRPVAWTPACTWGRRARLEDRRRIRSWNRCPAPSCAGSIRPPCRAGDRRLHLPDLPPLQVAGAMLHLREEAPFRAPAWADRHLHLDAPR